MSRTPFIALIALAASVRILAAEPALSVSFAEKTHQLSLEDLGRLPHVVVVATDPHEKVSHRYSGVSVHDLLASVGAPFGDKMRGPALRLAVLVRSQDGYTVLFALPEFDESFSERTIVIADRVDGAPLAGKSGPLRLIAPGDKHAARWARMVASIEIFQPAPGGPKRP